VSLIIERFFQGYEEVGYAFVAEFLGDMFPNLIDLDRFNVRRRHLIIVIEAIHRNFRCQKVDPDNPVRLVDSAPITLMIYSRGKRCRSFAGSQFFGVATSKKGKLFGLRLLLTASGAVHAGKVTDTVFPLAKTQSKPALA
jgi:hypothetical protein